MTYVSYQSRGRKIDFVVSYRWLPAARQRPFQGMRCDWAYEDPPNIVEAWMIWPEFLEDAGSVITEDRPIPLSGQAAMYVVDDTLRRDVHASRVRVGTTGHFVVGSTVIADATVISLANLRDA